MSFALWDINTALFASIDQERAGKARPFVEELHQYGLRVRLTQDGDTRITPDASEVTDVLGGAETDNNLRLLSNYFANMRNFATYTVRGMFISAVAPHVQITNRSVESNLRNLSPGLSHMLTFLKAFVGKEVKHPIRFLECSTGSNDYGQDPELVYSDAETGTAHTLQTLGENQSWPVWSTYLEDTPSLRRYIRYVDSLAQRYGMRLVYCPKEFNHPEELGQPARPTWSRDGDRVVRQVHAERFKVLTVQLAFDYEMFRDLSVVETEVQPGQRYRQASQMDYAPIFVDNLNGVVQVLTTLGSFPACKIYYKDYRNSARSSQAAPSSSEA